MVRFGARSGYEIKQTVERSIRFYPSLERLERTGLLTGRADPQGKRPRRVYETTVAGRAAIGNWLRRDEPMPVELRDVGLVKLFFADALERDDAATLLAAVKLRSQQAAAALRAIEPAAELVNDQGNAHPPLTLRLGIALHQAMINVCGEFTHQFAA